MSTQTEISRIQDARNVLRNKAVELGIAASTAKIDTLATAYDAIENKGAVSANVKEGESFTIPKGYHSGSGTVKITLEEKSATPTKSSQSITPSSGKVLSKVTVAAIPSNYIDTSDADAVAANILDDKTAYVNGAKVTGTMPNNGAISKTIDGLSVTSATIPAGYTSGGTVSLTSDIEDALASI